MKALYFDLLDAEVRRQRLELGVDLEAVVAFVQRTSRSAAATAANSHLAHSAARFAATAAPSCLPFLSVATIGVGNSSPRSLLVSRHASNRG